MQLINRPLYYIPVYSSLNRDTLYVHLYRGKKENLENINEYYLRLQCGEYFKPPDLPDLIAYKDAVNNPLPYSPKVIDPDFEEKFIDEQVQENKEAEINKPVNRAAWIQIGLFTLSTHYRMNKYVVSLGYDAFSGSVNRLSNIWGAFGLSANSNWIDASLSMGVSSASRKHYTENENHDIIKSKGNMGLIFKGQVLPHFKHVFGMGLELTYNWSKDKECSYGWATIIIALGNWSN
ncbi:MAG: hypothetical protein JXB44_08225 [Calditrichaceae bacterium]|nr:hypothetical protein [Calditrichaceae bacterium]